MNIIWKSFEQLTTSELYAVLSLREQVFMLEQQSLYKDIDGADQQALHLLVFKEGALIAYLRLLPGTERTTIGRVVVLKGERGQGLGAMLLTTALDKAANDYPQHPVYLSSQVSRQGLYQRFGFKVISEPYDDGGILHVGMLMERESQ